MTISNITEGLVKESIGIRSFNFKDNLDGSYANERRFPFVFSMPVQFYTQADVIRYLKLVTAKSDTNPNDPTPKAIDEYIKSSRKYTDASYKDALTSVNAPTPIAPDSAEGSAVEEELGIDAIYTRPNQTTTEIGGNDAINCYWQFSWDDDLVPPMLSANKFKITPETGGLGRVYSEIYNNNQVLLNISVGVPKFQKLVDFYTHLFSRELVNMNTTGDSFPKALGRLMGTAVSLSLNIVTAPYRYFMKIVNFVSDDNITKYVDFHESMRLYYRYVNSILIELAVNMGLMPKILSSKKDGTLSTNGTSANIAFSDMVAGQIDKAKKVLNLTDDEDGSMSSFVPTMEATEAEMSHMMPIFKGGFDIWRILSIRDSRERASTSDPRINGPSTDAEIDSARDNKANSKRVENGGYTSTTVKSDTSWFAEWKDKWNAYWGRTTATWQGTDKFISFKIEKSTDCSESLSNTTGESQIQQYINSASDQARNAMGQLNILKELPVVGGIANFVKGMFEGVQNSAPGSILGVVSVLAGEARVDIPEVWQSSTFTKSYNFNIQLRAPYGDPYTIFQSIYIPLVMLLAMALPRAAGNSSYMQPFVLRAYSRGMFAIPYGIIDSMTIKRGLSEFGWSRNRLPTAVEVSFSIKDLSPFMIMAMDVGDSLNPLNLIMNIFAENTTFKEYLMTLSGMGLTERLLMMNNLKRRLSTTFYTLKSRFTPEYLGFATGDSALGRIIGVFANSNLPD